MALRGIARWSRGSVLRRAVAVAAWPRWPARRRSCGGPTATTSRSGRVRGHHRRGGPQPSRDRLRPAVVHARARAALRRGAHGPRARRDGPRARHGGERGPPEPGAATPTPGGEEPRREGGGVPAGRGSATGVGETGTEPAARHGRHEPAATPAPTSGSAPAPSGTSAPAPTSTSTRPRPRPRPPTADATPRRRPDATATPSPDGTASTAREHRARLARRPRRPRRIDRRAHPRTDTP